MDPLRRPGDPRPDPCQRATLPGRPVPHLYRGLAGCHGTAQPVALPSGTRPRGSVPAGHLYLTCGPGVRSRRSPERLTPPLSLAAAARRLLLKRGSDTASARTAVFGRVGPGHPEFADELL